MSEYKYGTFIPIPAELLSDHRPVSVTIDESGLKTYVTLGVGHFAYEVSEMLSDQIDGPRFGPAFPPRPRDRMAWMPRGKPAGPYVRVR